MKVVDKQGNEVKTGDIVWGRKNSFIFIRCCDPYIEVKTTDDRRMFMTIPPSWVNLKIIDEANHE